MTARQDAALTREQVEELDALYEKATKGPWYLLQAPWLPSDCETTILSGSPDPHAGKFVCDFENFAATEDDEKNQNSWGDAELIVALVNAWPQIRASLPRQPSAEEVREACIRCLGIGSDAHQESALTAAAERIRSLDLSRIGGEGKNVVPQERPVNTNGVGVTGHIGQPSECDTRAGESLRVPAGTAPGGAEGLVDVVAWLNEAADDVESWGAYAGEYFQTKHDLQGNAAQYRERAKQAAAHLSRSREDAERIDWLEQHDGRFYNLDSITSIVGVGFNRMPTLRAAIDAAIAAARKPK